MPYSTQKALPGREPVYILEIKLTSCSNTYGNSPCTATGAAGAECFNTFGTCQDVPNFTTTTKTYRFSSIRLDTLQAAGDAPTFPTIQAVSTAPTTLTPGKGLGVRSTLSVKLSDHPWTCQGVDPYVANRSYDPDLNGTFWGKLLARDPYYEGREVTLKTGYLADDGTYDAANFVSRTYFVDTITGPDKNGAVMIKGKDILKFADNSKAQLPVQSEATLDADITDVATSFDITDPNDDIKDAYDDTTNVGASQTYIRVDDEVMLVTNMTGTTPDYTLTVTRAAKPAVYTGTIEADDHEQDSTVQHCYFFNALEIDNIVYYLLNTVAGIDSSYLPTTDWQTVINAGLTSYLFSTLLTEPIGVKDLLDEITEHTILLWWDERDQEVKMDSLLNATATYGTFDDDEHVVADSVAIARGEKERISQVWLAFGHRSPVLELDELKNFTTVKVAADLTLESSDAYSNKRVRRIFSRWLPTTAGAISGEISNRILNYYKYTKNVVTMTLDPKDDDIWTGGIFTMTTRQVQDKFGASFEGKYRVLQVSEVLKPGQVSYNYVVHSIGEPGAVSRSGIIAPNGTADYTSASDADKDAYGFIAYESISGFTDATSPYTIV